MRKNVINYRVINAMIIIIFLLISLFLRVPYYNTPIGNHHQWLTAFTLRTLEIYDQTGIAKSSFALNTTYPNSANKFIINQSMVPDSNGNMFYTSYPSFSIILPYLIFKILFVGIGPLQLKFFGIFIHFISCILLYLIISMIVPKKNNINIPGLIGVFIMCFTAATLWFTSNVYFADTMIQPIYIAATYFFLRVVKNDSEKYNKYFIIAIGVLSFTGGFTDWLMYLWGFFAGLYCIINYKRPNMLKCLAVIILSLLAALILFLIQLLTIAGESAFLNWLLRRLMQRTGLSYNHTLQLDPKLWFTLFNNYWINYSLYMYLAFIGVIILPILWVITSIITKRFKEIESHVRWEDIKIQFLSANFNIEKTAIYLSLIPILAHTVLLFQFSIIHDFTSLKFSFFLSILCALIYNRFDLIYIAGKRASFLMLTKLLIIVVIIISSVFSIKSYYEYNDDIKTSYFYDLGKIVTKYAKNDEVVFFSSDKSMIVYPQTVYYAKRNIAEIIPATEHQKLKKTQNDELKESTRVDIEDAKKLIKLNNVRRGIVFNFEKGRLNNISYVEP